MPYPYPHHGMAPTQVMQGQRVSYAQPMMSHQGAPVVYTHTPQHAPAPAPAAPVVSYQTQQPIAQTQQTASQATRVLGPSNAVGLDLNRDGRYDLIVGGAPQDSAPEVLHQDGIGNSAGGYFTTGGEAVPAMEEEPMTVTLVVPEGATPGTKLQHTAPDGQELRLTVPDGVPAGSVMTLTQDPVTKGWKCMAEPSEPAAPPAPAPYEPPPAATGPYAGPQTTERVVSYAAVPTGAPPQITTYLPGQAPTVRTMVGGPPGPGMFRGHQIMPVNLSYVPPPNHTSSVAMAPGQVTAGILPAHFNPPRQDPMMPPGMILGQRPSYTPPPVMVMEQRPSYTPPPVMQVGGPPPGQQMDGTIKAFPQMMMVQTPSYVPPPVMVQNSPSYVPPPVMIMGPPPHGMTMVAPGQMMQVHPGQMLPGPCMATMPTQGQPMPMATQQGPPPGPPQEGQGPPAQREPAQGPPMQPQIQAGPPPGHVMHHLPPGVQYFTHPMGSGPVMVQGPPGQPPMVIQHQVMPGGPMAGGTTPGHFLPPGAHMMPPGHMMPPHMQQMPMHMVGPGGVVMQAMHGPPPGQQFVLPPQGQGPPMQPGSQGQPPPQGPENP